MGPIGGLLRKIGSCRRKFLALFLTCMLFLPLTSGFAQTDAIRIGILQEPKTLNVWLASDAWSSRVLSQIYEPLYIREPKTLDLIPWLAADQPTYDPSTLSYTVDLRPGQWSDGSPITAADVVFTGRLIKTFRIPRYISNWNFIERVEAIDARTVRFVLKHPEAIFTTRTLTTPIVQKKRWAPILETLASQESRPMPLGAMIHHVKTRHRFDAFVLGYGRLSLDPDYIRNFFLSKNSKPKGWNTSGYDNPQFDRIANQSARTLDREKRRALIYEMQQIIMRDLPWIPLYCPKLEEGARTDRFAGWVNMVGGIGNHWSFCRIVPK